MSQTERGTRALRRRELVLLIAALIAVAGSTWAYTRWLRLDNPTIVSLTLVLIVFVTAAQATLRVAIATSIAAVATFNFFFLPPVGTFTIADPQNWFALLTLLIVSVLVSRLSTQVQSRATDAMARRDELTRLFDLTRDILLTTDVPDPLATIAAHIARRFRLGHVAIYERQAGRWVRHATDDAIAIPEPELDGLLAAATTKLQFDARTRTYGGGGAVEPEPGRRVWLEPLRLGMSPIGILALDGPDLASGARDAIAGVTAIAVERLQFLEERKQADLVRRSAELKSALLASLSHDLRTPLTAATVAASNVKSGFLDGPARDEQLDLVQSELARLNRLFENIVEMARIEAHAVRAEPDWAPPAEIVWTAIDHVEPALRSHRIVVVADEHEVVRTDPRLVSASLSHLVENAAQYSPAGTAIHITAVVRAPELQIEVRDHGAGIAAADRDRVFERLYRGVAGQSRFGTGMGLAIARGLVAAAGGRVWVDNHRQGGAIFTIAVPVETRVAPAPAAEVP